MPYRYWVNMPRLLLGLYFFQLFFTIGHCFNFNNNYTGVVFEPYVKQTESYQDVSSYTFEHITTMLTVVSGTFNKVFVHDGSYLLRGTYIANFTYYHASHASLRAGEVAGLINRENDKTRLTVMYNIVFSHRNKNVETDILLVLEAAQIANVIFPGTVEAIVLMFTEPEELQFIQTNIELVRAIRERASQLNVLLGFVINGLEFSQAEAVISEYHQLFAETDLIGFEIGPLTNTEELSPQESFNELQWKLLDFRNAIWKVNSNAQVFAATGWPSSLVEGEGGAKDLKAYWEIVSVWAFEQKFKVYMVEAFDNPWKEKISNHSGHVGWWKLTENSKIGTTAGYVEKVSVNLTSTGQSIEKEDEDFTLTVWNASTITLAIVGGILAVLIIFTIGVLAYYHVNRSSGLSNREIRAFLFGTTVLTEDGNTALMDSVNGLPYDNALEIPKDKLRIEKNHRLGFGQFGFVVGGFLETVNDGEIEVAVKVAKNKCSSDALKQLLFEIKIMSFLGNHPNIVVLKGAYTAELSKGIVNVVTELCILGSLQNYLRNGESNQVDSTRQQRKVLDESAVELMSGLSIHVSDMARWSYEIACGMEHLESKRVVHADLATRNVLLTSNKTAKIADFGLSRRMYNYTEYVKKGKEPLPWRWMAIESLKRMEFSSKSDVWSYGITLWEIFSMGNLPYPGSTCNQEFIDELVNGLRPKCPSSTQPNFYKLMRLCWDLEPTRRPCFNELVGYTNNWLKNFEGKEDELDYLENSNFDYI